MISLQNNFRISNKHIFKKTLHTTCAYLQTNTSSQEEAQTHFGFENVKKSEKEHKVQEVFSNVANKYDLMNDVMSVGIHRFWKDLFIQRLAPSIDTKLVDVAGGTGDIAFRYINYLLNLPNTTLKDITAAGGNVTICDINELMLKEGQKRANKQNLSEKIINWKIENAEKLSFADNEFTAYTIAFGIRNVTCIDKVLEEAYRVLKPGGRFMCLEFSQLNNSFIQWAYDQYSFSLIPVMGQLITGKWQPYKYLVESIRKFPNQEDFKQMIQEAGFRNVTYENLTMGIVAIHSGFKI